MSNTELLDLPKQGFSGLKQNWRHDLIAAVSVALVALPLGLGISIASGSAVPPMAGVISAIIGGLLTTFIRGSNVGINGPGAGLVGVSLIGVVTLAKVGGGTGYNHYMAVIMVAGAMQALMGLLKWGKYGELLPASVVRGVLAAIGIIIFASQIHIAFDTGFGKATAMDSISAIPGNLKNINWPIGIIALVSLAILIIHPMFIGKLRVLHYIPAPMLVLLAAVPFVFIFGLQENHIVHLFNREFMVGPKNLIHVDDITKSFNLRPDFSLIKTGTFWATAISVFLVSTIETIPSSKAVDKLDPYKRTTNLNKDLIGTGISTIVAGFLGGLPVITVIVRSSLNINHGARTKWSNFFHGLILLALVFFLIDEIQMVPLAALAAILVFTGVKLASPKMFRDTMKLGYEQFVIVAFTIISTLQYNLKTGLIAGILITILIHLVKSHIPINLFFKYLLKPQYQLSKDENKVVLKVKGISNFSNVLNLTKQLQEIGLGNDVIIDFSQARLVDHSVLEILKDWDDKNANKGGSFDIIGLDMHVTTSQHPLSLHVLPPKSSLFLSKRQQRLKELSAKNKWVFDPNVVGTKSRFRKFMLFESRPIEYSKNRIMGTMEDPSVKWEICDITFDEGAFLATEVHHTTVVLVSMEGFNIPRFEIEEERWLKRFLDFAKREEISFDDEKFTDDFAVKGSKPEQVKSFFTREIIDYLSQNSRYHIEGNKNGLMVFQSYRFASSSEVEELLEFTKGLVALITNKQAKS
jgi:carbonic anhydrase